MNQVKIAAQMVKIHTMDVALGKLSAAVSKQKALIDAEETKLIQMLRKAKLDTCRSGSLRASLGEREHFGIENWDAFVGFVKKTRAYDLFQRRINSNSLKEKLKKGIRVPGVSVFKEPTVSVTVVKGKE